MEHASDDLNGSWEFFSRKYLLEESGDEAKRLLVLILTICCLLCAIYYVWVWLNDGLRNLARWLECVLWVVNEMSDNDRFPSMINKNQCELLRAECQRLSAQCQRLGNLCKPVFARQDFVLQEFYCPVRKALKLVQDCRAENWLLKAVEFGNCREHFLEVLRDIHRLIAVLQNLVPDRGGEPQNFDIQDNMDDHRVLDGIDLEEMVRLEYRDGHYLADQLREERESFNAPPEISRHVTEFDISSTPLIFSAADSEVSFTRPTVIVFRVVHSNEPFVIKMLWRKVTAEEPQNLDQEQDALFKEEADIMKECSHPYAVGLVGYWEVTSQYPNVPLLLMESMECNLKELLGKRNKPPMLRNMWRGTRGFPALDAINLVLPVAKALRHMHETGFVHRDIKPQNILCTRVPATQHLPADISVKLADFGTAQGGAISTGAGPVGTFGYMDPYLLNIPKGVPYGDDRLFKADVFSFGLVFGEVLTGLSPAEALDCIHVNLELFNTELRGNRPPLPEDAPQFVKFIIERCCTENPAERPSFEEICSELQHLRY